MVVIGLAILLAAFWLAFSGFFTGLLLSLGALSIVLVIWLVLRADAVDGRHVHLRIRPVKWVFYSLWLVKEIALSNVDVVKRILRGANGIDPQVVKLPVSQKTEAGRVIYANSITLTPGTVSIDLDDESVTVHALSREGVEALETGEMDRRVRALETVR